MRRLTDWFIVSVVMLCLAAMLFAFGVPMPWRFDGRWALATTQPRICFTMDACGTGTIDTGWHKANPHDVWYRYLGEPVQDVTVAELQARGDVSYPGETAKQTAARRAERQPEGCP